MSDPLSNENAILIFAMCSEIAQWREAADEVRRNVERMCYNSNDLDELDADNACAPFDGVVRVPLPAPKENPP